MGMKMSPRPTPSPGTPGRRVAAAIEGRGEGFSKCSEFLQKSLDSLRLQFFNRHRIGNSKSPHSSPLQLGQISLGLQLLPDVPRERSNVSSSAAIHPNLNK